MERKKDDNERERQFRKIYKEVKKGNKKKERKEERRTEATKKKKRIFTEETEDKNKL